MRISISLRRSGVKQSIPIPDIRICRAYRCADLCADSRFARGRQPAAHVPGTVPLLRTLRRALLSARTSAGCRTATCGFARASSAVAPVSKNVGHCARDQHGWSMRPPNVATKGRRIGARRIRRTYCVASARNRSPRVSPISAPGRNVTGNAVAPACARHLGQRLDLQGRIFATPPRE